MKVLAIGNSFSQDATYYLHQIAKDNKVEMKVVNLYIGGCNLERHWENIVFDKKEYLYELNGHSLDKYVSIKEVINEEKWDFIITQQASHDSGWKDTYEPFLSLICDYIRKEQPNAKIMLHKTWAYEIDSTHGGFIRYNKNQFEMFERLNYAYNKVAKENDLSLIESGVVIQELRKENAFDYKNGGKSLCRDGFHMDFMYGRYVLAATWFSTLCNISLLDSKFIPECEYITDETFDQDIISLINKVVDKVVFKK